MYKNFAIFGNHPSLALAELGSVVSKIKKAYLSDNICLVECAGWDGSKLMETLGGTVKLGDYLAEFDLKDCTGEQIAEVLEKSTTTRALDFGWTVYGGTPKDKALLKHIPIELKKALKKQGCSVRWVTGQGQVPLSPAAVAKCKLTEKPNADLCALIQGGKVWIGRTTNVQNADAWSLRDFGRPERDDLNGMLPPKLARMMVNLSAITKNETLLDPFCGGGTVNMEAVLLSHNTEIIGSDIDARQVSDSIKNMDWMMRGGIINSEDRKRIKIFKADARTINKQLTPNSVDCVVSEGFLGPPLRGYEKQLQLDKTAGEISRLWSESLRSLHACLKPNARLVIILPSFQTDFARARVKLDNLKDLGYELINPLAFYKNEIVELKYVRQGQRVTRHVVVLKKV